MATIDGDGTRKTLRPATGRPDLDTGELMTMENDRFVSPCPAPTEHQREIATILIEECAEVQQRATKLVRFGVDEIQPGQPYTNAQRLAAEVGDVLLVVDYALAAGIIDRESIERGRMSKLKQLAKYLQIASPCPFDGPHNLKPEDPCPVCGDTDEYRDGPSNCLSQTSREVDCGTKARLDENMRRRSVASVAGGK